MYRVVLDFFRSTHWTHPVRLVVLSLSCMIAVTTCVTSVSSPEDETLLETITEEIIPREGTETSYGLSLSLTNLPQFLDWYYEIDLDTKESDVLRDALVELVAPCCDDNTMFRCCCEKGERACNLVRSGKGLASYLIHDKGYTAEEVRAAVLQWLHFARPDYYVARELKERGLNPRHYNLTTFGSCYRQLCEVPISQGGCGGMNELTEPAIEGEEI